MNYPDFLCGLVLWELIKHDLPGDETTKLTHKYVIKTHLIIDYVIDFFKIKNESEIVYATLKV